MESVILEEDIDENYEPTEAEIEEYAQWLGMVSPDDDDLRWIAREGLKAPLPEHWKVRAICALRALVVQLPLMRAGRDHKLPTCE